MSRRRFPVWLLLVAFVVVPLLEIFVLIQVGQVIGAWWTILLLVADSILGTWLIRREGGRAWTALRTALGTGAMPARELADGALILVGGTLMLSPGFVTDLLGIALILPMTRPLARRALTRVVARRLMGSGMAAYAPRTGPGGGVRDAGGNARRPHPDPGGSVVEGEVVE
ncbi:FxsA family protein [Nocardioides sp.]|uniref:FxsA family protein n=1 Tax=Nocardioides sp. TaxID=35761 RepID=UPI002CCCEA7E|nr:FxsA family protein [Nocardioides sp.]HXH81180.1 FxsA family protein [Nocardioides sp.]